MGETFGFINFETFSEFCKNELIPRLNELDDEVGSNDEYILQHLNKEFSAQIGEFHPDWHVLWPRVNFWILSRDKTTNRVGLRYKYGIDELHSGILSLDEILDAEELFNSIFIDGYSAKHRDGLID